MRQIGKRQYKLTQIRKKQAKSKSFWREKKIHVKIEKGGNPYASKD
jgi:hypothetical protein